MRSATKERLQTNPEQQMNALLVLEAHFPHVLVQILPQRAKGVLLVAIHIHRLQVAFFAMKARIKIGLDKGSVISVLVEHILMLLALIQVLYANRVQ